MEPADLRNGDDPATWWGFDDEGELWIPSPTSRGPCGAGWGAGGRGRGSEKRAYHFPRSRRLHCIGAESRPGRESRAGAESRPAPSPGHRAADGPARLRLDKKVSVEKISPVSRRHPRTSDRDRADRPHRTAAGPVPPGGHERHAPADRHLSRAARGERPSQPRGDLRPRADQHAVALAGHDLQDPRRAGQARAGQRAAGHRQLAPLQRQRGSPPPPGVHALRPCHRLLRSGARPNPGAVAADEVPGPAPERPHPRALRVLCAG